MRFGFPSPHLRDEIGEGSESSAGATGNIDGIDAEALMGQIGSGQSVSPSQATDSSTITTQDPSPPSQSAQTPAPGAQTQDPEVELTIDGKIFKAPMSRVKQWASQGRNYAQLMEQFKSRESQFNTNFKRYEEIDQYAKSNPQWWAHVQESFQNKNSQASVPGQASAQLPPEVEQKLSQLDQLVQFKEQFESEQAVQKIESEIKGVRDQYPDLPWTTLDANGQSLEMRVLDHAQNTGIQSFKAAFRDLMHDDLIKHAADKAKEAAVKELQAQRRTGLVGVSSTPQRQPARAPGKFRDMTEAAEAAKAELGLIG